MNHLTRQLTLIHQDDLRRAAANHRLAQQVSSDTVTALGPRARRVLRKRGLARFHRVLTRPGRRSIIEPRTSVVERSPILK